MIVSKHAVSEILASRGLSASELSERTKIDVMELSRIISGESSIDIDSAKRIAKACGVPPQALFARLPIDIEPVVDFRRATPSATTLESGVVEAMGFVERLSSTLVALNLVPELDVRLKDADADFIRESATVLAKKWRKNWGFTAAEQVEAADSNVIYRSLREFIEGLGVMVIHYGLNTSLTAGIYSRIDSGPHVITINTYQSSKARKLFTLAHEFGHVLLGKEGASNPSSLLNKIEKYCNKFAAYLIAPDDAISAVMTRYKYKASIDPVFVRNCAKNLGISQEALVLRLVELGMLSVGQYKAWRRSFDGITPPGDLSDGGGGRSDPLVTKRTKYGSLLLATMREARSLGKLDAISVYRLCGLKPKYQNKLFGV